MTSQEYIFYFPIEQISKEAVRLPGKTDMTLLSVFYYREYITLHKVTFVFHIDVNTLKDVLNPALGKKGQIQLLMF